jgi:hypothetical protein
MAENMSIKLSGMGLHSLIQFVTYVHLRLLGISVHLILRLLARTKRMCDNKTSEDMT